MLKRVLEELLQIEGVTTAALIADDGFLIESVGTVQVDKDALAVLGSCAMQFFYGPVLFWRRVSPVLVLEYLDGTIIFTQVSDEEMLAVITGIQSTSGRLAQILPRITTRIKAVI